MALCALAAVLALAGCRSAGKSLGRSTPHPQVPEEALYNAALDIEEAVMNGDPDAEIPSREGLELAAPRIRQAIRTRTMRYKLLVPLYEEGHICEKANGHVYLYNVLAKAYRKSRERRQKNRDALIVMNETNDRRALYMAIIEANNFKTRARTAVESVFYRARIAVLPEGYQYEDAEGQLLTKASPAETEAAQE